MSVIQATQEAEIRRITVQSQPWANSSRDPVSQRPFTKSSPKHTMEKIQPLQQMLLGKLDIHM
jgi:hypothetical protein